MYTGRSKFNRALDNVMSDNKEIQDENCPMSGPSNALFAGYIRTRTSTRPSVRATIGYHVYNLMPITFSNRDRDLKT